MGLPWARPRGVYHSPLLPRDLLSRIAEFDSIVQHLLVFKHVCKTWNDTCWTGSLCEIPSLYSVTKELPVDETRRRMRRAIEDKDLLVLARCWFYLGNSRLGHELLEICIRRETDRGSASHHRRHEALYLKVSCHRLACCCGPYSRCCVNAANIIRELIPHALSTYNGAVEQIACLGCGFRFCHDQRPLIRETLRKWTQHLGSDLHAHVRSLLPLATTSSYATILPRTALEISFQTKDPLLIADAAKALGRQELRLKRVAEAKNMCELALKCNIELYGPGPHLFITQSHKLLDTILNLCNQESNVLCACSHCEPILWTL